MNATSTSSPRSVLHLLTAPPDAFTRGLLERQSRLAKVQNLKVEIVDLDRAAGPDYHRVLEQIFMADSVSTW